ncbi:MAG: protein kinase, partial [Planctomycetota bacterium]
MPFEENPKSCGERIDSAYNRFCEAWHNGERLDPAEYCAEHSESGPELLDRINNFLFVMEGCLDESPGCDLAGDQERGAANGPRVLGEFTLLREIGRGGMGVVYEAEQASLRRRVALKVLPRHLTLARGAIRKFRREAEAGGRQNHPGIVTTYALGEEDGIHFIAQELVEGSDTLAARIESLRKGGQVPLGYFREAATLVARVAEAIEHAHASGVIHRDIKPSNILITRQGDPKVSDFGLAKVEDALALSRTGDFSGTPYYMSPEQAASRRIGIDHRTDIFSLGVTLYEMLTLARPFDGETTQDVLKKILLDEPRDPRKVNPRLPNDLAVICLKAMEKKPEERYATMADFAGDLRRFLNGETILARPVGMVTKLRKRVQRNPALSGAVLVAGLSLLVLLVILPEMIRLQKSDEAIETLIREKKLTEMGQRLIGEAQVTSKEDGTLSLLLALYGARQILKVNPGPDYSLYNLLMRLMDEVREKKIISLGLISSGTLCPDFKKTAYSLIDGRLFILDIESKSKEEILVDPGFWPIRALAFSPDGNSLAVGTERGEIRVWSEDFQKWSEPMQAQSGAVRSLAFNPRDAHQLLIACKEPTALLWNFETQEKVLELKGHSGFLQSVVFSPDGGRIITASEDGTARIWDSASGDLLITLEHAAYVTCAGLSQDGKKAITGTSDGQVRLFDLETGAPPRILEKNHSALTCVGFNEGKDQLYAASSDGTLYVYEGTHLEEPDKFVGHKDAIVQAMAHSLGTEFMTLSLDGTLRVWSSMPMLRHSLTKLEEGVWDYDFDNCKDRLLRASNDKKTMEVWDVDKGEPVFSCRIDDAFTKKAILVPDRVPIEYVISDGGESFYPWNPETGERHQAIHLKKELFTKTVRLSPSGRYLFALPTYNNARLWDVDLNREVCIVLVHGDPRWLTFTPDESRLLIGASKGRAEIIDIKGEKFVNDKALQDWLD